MGEVDGGFVGTSVGDVVGCGRVGAAEGEVVGWPVGMRVGAPVPPQSSGRKYEVAPGKGLATAQQGSVAWRQPPPPGRNVKAWQAGLSRHEAAQASGVLPLPLCVWAQMPSELWARKRSIGSRVGAGVGVAVGRGSVGVRVGVCVGTVGVAVGVGVGRAVGVAVGVAVGREVGGSVGDGVRVGAAVGASVTQAEVRAYAALSVRGWAEQHRAKEKPHRPLLME